MTVEKVRAAVAAAGVFLTLVIGLVTLAVVSSVNASPTESDDVYTKPPQSDLLKHLSLLYQDTYVLYGKGRRSERDLPVCATPGQACNLAHRRYWLTPITERLCRCADRLECPLHYSSLNDTTTQHVSNRAQLRFCNNIVEELPECANGEPALKIKKTEWKGLRYPPNGGLKNEGVDTQSTLLCRCPWPNRWTLTKTTKASDTEMLFLYTCDELPKCTTGEECGHIRADTLESYYSCSCPQHHICVYRRPRRTIVTSQLHFEGHAYPAHCIPN